MAVIRPFAAYRFNRELGLDYSNLIAPPYDVLDEMGKAALTLKSDYNIVTVDLPHLPPKTVGPDETYAQADATLKSWIADGVVRHDHKAGFYPYEQTYLSMGRTFHRRGFFCLVKLTPFSTGDLTNASISSGGVGGGVVPHERTYKGPIEDRLKLLRATGMQLSPIFGLFHDPKNEVTTELFGGLGRPEMSATLGDVKNDLWSVTDAGKEARVIDLMKGRAIYIADGHHRYTTALQYQHEMELANGGPLPPTHPANYCLFTLVSMQNDGLQILPTHRLIKKLESFDLNKFASAVAPFFTLKEVDLPHDEHMLLHIPQHAFVLFDGATSKSYLLTSTGADPLAESHKDQSPAWRRLDVAVLQHYLIEQVLQPLFNAGHEVVKDYSAEVAGAIGRTDGVGNRLALILKPTPLSALVELGQTGEVMPQKSTYFYPKLATGMVMASLK
jgi:uncharacterized protein (DUF1015 family)